MTALIVEDDVFQSFILEKMVKGLGLDIVGKAKTGEEATQLAVELKPFVIFMDISLEGAMDGIEAAGIIKKKIPANIIYITGNADNYHRMRAAETDYIDYLIKPVTREILEHSLKKLSN